MKKETDFRKCLERLAHGHSTRTVFDAFVRFAACAMAMGTREAEYLEEAKQWKREELDLFAHALGALVMEMEREPFTDLLGAYYMEYALSTKGQQWHGEFHTPKSICDFMARLTLGETLPAEGPITVCEPACGAGAMILSLGEAVEPQDRRRLRITAIDINRTACDMCFINTTLWGIPTRVIHGNTISGEYWSAWSNIHFIMPWLPLALRAKVIAENRFPTETVQQGQPPAEEEIQLLNRTFRQTDLFAVA